MELKVLDAIWYDTVFYPERKDGNSSPFADEKICWWTVVGQRLYRVHVTIRDLVLLTHMNKTETCSSRELVVMNLIRPKSQSASQSQLQKS